MFHIRYINNKINRLHKRALCIVYKDFKSSFKNLLEKDGTVSIYVKNLQQKCLRYRKTFLYFSVNDPVRKLIIAIC